MEVVAKYSGVVRQRGRTAGVTKNEAVCIRYHNGVECVAMVVNYPADARGVVASGVTLVDADNYEMVRDISWSIHSTGYVYGHLPDGRNVTMHGLILPQVVEGDGTSVDHVNWQKLDNRKVNLMRVGQAAQNANRGQRADQLEPPTEIKALGIPRLLRYMRLDPVENKFVFNDHPIAKAFPGTNTSSTKCGDASIVQKFKHGAIMMKAMCDAHPALAAKIAGDDIEDLRVELATEHNSIVRFAYMSDPTIFSDGPYADLNKLRGETSYLDWVLEKLADVEVVVGAQNRPATRTTFGDIAYTSKEYKDGAGIATRIIMYDAVHATAFARLSAIDVSGISPTIHVDRVKVNLKDFVWTHIFRKPIAAGHVIVPMNYQQYDLREENLVAMPGDVKTYRAPSSWVMPDGMLGMRYVPRGISLSTPATGFNIVFTNGTPSANKGKISTTKQAQLLGAMKRAVEILRADDPSFDAKNEVFQRMAASYDDFVASIAR